MNTFPLPLYRRLQLLLPFDLLVDKLLGAILLASLPPLLALVATLLLAPAPLSAATLIGLVAIVTLLSLGAAVWLMRVLIAPVTLAQLALYAYRREQRLLPLPLDLDGEVGSLMSDLRAPIETCERQRQIFAEQAEWAFRNKSSPLLDQNGSPRALRERRMA